MGCGDDCIDCAAPEESCPKSEKPCGHHCAHSWTHERCCWCGTEWGEGGTIVTGDEAEK